jgi:hypothetical protein
VLGIRRPDVLGDLSIQGNIKGLRSLAAILRVTFNGVPEHTFYSHLTQTEFRFNLRRGNPYATLLKVLTRYDRVVVGRNGELSRPRRATDVHESRDARDRDGRERRLTHAKHALGDELEPLGTDTIDSSTRRIPPVHK